MAAMTVKQLIRELEGYDDDTPVHIAYNYGDHWKTVVTPKLTCVSDQWVVHSDYHGMDRLAEQSDIIEMDDDDKSEPVVVLSAMKLEDC